MPRKVVVAVDPSPVSLDTLRWASRSLCNKDDELHLVSVLESGLPNDVVGESTADSNLDCKPNPEALASTQELLSRCRREAEGAGLSSVKATTLVSCAGGAADMVGAVAALGRHITEFADSEHADLLVLGSRGMGGVKRTLLGLVGLGSVSDFVTKHAATNVVVHKMEPTAQASGTVLR